MPYRKSLPSICQIARAVDKFAHDMASKRTYSLFFFLVSLLYPGMCLSDTTTYIGIVDYGIYTGDIHEKVSCDQSPTGWVGIQRNLKLVSRSDVVPAILGVQFGFRFEIKGDASEGGRVVILTRLKYPGLTDKKTGKVFHETELVQHAKIGHRSYVGYVLEEEWELVPGKWTFEVHRDGNQVAERSFTVYKP